VKKQTLAAALLAALITPSALSAAPQVTASIPAEGTAVARPRTVSLTFNEPMLPAQVATTIVMTAMPGMTDHPPMTIRNFEPAWSKDGKTLTLTLRQPLVTGSYDLRWQAADTSGKNTSGKISFSVE
jgi:methionine-rich copper-binding protein CopC